MAPECRLREDRKRLQRQSFVRDALVDCSQGPIPAAVPSTHAQTPPTCRQSLSFTQSSHLLARKSVKAGIQGQQSSQIRGRLDIFFQSCYRYKVTENIGSLFFIRSD